MDEWLSEELHKYEDGGRTDMGENIRTTNIYVKWSENIEESWGRFCSDRGQMSFDFYINSNLWQKTQINLKKLNKKTTKNQPLNM